MKKSKYIIGIDLGTTNCAVAYMNMAGGEEENEEYYLFEIPQVVQAGSVEKRETMPSFLYSPGEVELPEGSIKLPWNEKPEYTVGEFARNHGSKLPHRMISSAKSWLCNSDVDRKAKILPWRSPEEVKKYSPLEAAGLYLTHIKEAWNYEFSSGGEEEKMENQEIILTVPASFDPVARELTVEAATGAGLKVTLIEEPQAAFYSWLSIEGDEWRNRIKVGDIVLICDIGGGTTDFSLIAVGEDDGNLILERVAVGEHILLGGDNMDLALAVKIRENIKKENINIDSWQLQVLSHECRKAKEKLSGDEKLETFPLVIPGRGSKLIGGAVKTELKREILENIMIEGFFPMVAPSDHPAKGLKAGLREMGLPYSSEPAITRHLAKFLSSHRKSLKNFPELTKEGRTFVHPTAVLFNGGVMNSSELQNRLLDCINSWLEKEGSEPVRLLEASDLDLAVAYGASYYGRVRQGQGIRIRGGTANTYYIGLQSSMPAVPGMAIPIKALCVAPYGMEEGTSLEVPGQDFGLAVGENVEFQFLGSSTRREDEIGSIVEDWEEEDIHEVTSITAELPGEDKEGKLIPVKMESHVTEVGTLELRFVEKAGKDNWKLEFDVREKAG